jgi:hypothetical protein
MNGRVASPENRKVKRFRLMRFVVNLFVFTFAYIVLLNAIRWAVPSAKGVVEFLWAPWGIAMIVWVLPWFVLSVAFTFGAIRCPLCGNSFGRRYGWVSRRCSSCHQDVLAPPTPGQQT